MDRSIRRKPESAGASITASHEGAGALGRLLPTNRPEGFSDAVFAIAITLLVLELHVPTGHQALVKGLEHEWPRYLGYFVSFAFIGGVWIAHSNMTRFIEVADQALMRLNLTLLLFVSFLPFTTAVAVTHLFASSLLFTHTIAGTGLTAERVAGVAFGLNLTLAALMVYLVMRHAGRTPGPTAGDMAEEELQAFARERRAATLLQASATVVGVFLPVIAVIFYLAVSVLYVVEPLWHIRIRIRRRAPAVGGRSARWSLAAQDDALTLRPERHGAELRLLRGFGVEVQADSVESGAPGVGRAQHEQMQAQPAGRGIRGVLAAVPVDEERRHGDPGGR
jgi:uncharacterized membrane protein